MKKLIAFGVTLMMLLLGFTAAVEIGIAGNGVNVCSDLKPKPEPYDQRLM